MDYKYPWTISIHGLEQINKVNGAFAVTDELCNTVYLPKIRQDKNNYCCVLPKQIEIKLQISHRNANVPNN